MAGSTESNSEKHNLEERPDLEERPESEEGDWQNLSPYREMQTINERLVITSVHQQEHAQRAEEAETRAAEALDQMKMAHEGLHATHQHLQETHATIQAAYTALQAAYDREHRIAQALQQSMTLEVPEDVCPGLSIATLYSAAWAEAEVGGDFYDAIPLTDGRLALVVGDASGKGLTAAARAMEVKDVLRAYLRLYPFYPGLALTRLSDYLCDTQSLDERAQDTFVALCLVIISVQASEAIFAWAGIEAPLLLRADGALERVVGAGIPLGIVRGNHYAETTVTFFPGDMVLLSTDGLSEARQGRDFLGEDGVDALVLRSLEQQAAGKSGPPPTGKSGPPPTGKSGQPTVRDVGMAILAGAREYAGGKLTDDACLVLARRH